MIHAVELKTILFLMIIPFISGNAEISKSQNFKIMPLQIFGAGMYNIIRQGFVCFQVCYIKCHNLLLKVPILKQMGNLPAKPVVFKDVWLRSIAYLCVHIKQKLPVEINVLLYFLVENLQIAAHYSNANEQSRRKI